MTTTLSQAIDAPNNLGTSVAFYDTTGVWGAVSAAEHLARIGKRVTIFTTSPTYGWHITKYSKPAVIERLQRLGARTSPGLQIIAWRDGRLEVANVDTGAVERLDGYDSEWLPATALPGRN